MDRIKMEDSRIFVRQLFWVMGISSVIANASIYISQIIGTAISGQVLSASALVIAGISAPVYYVYAALAFCISSGCTVMCSNYIGESKFEESKQTLTTAYLIGILLSVIMTIAIWIFIDPIVLMLGATPENAEGVRLYCLAMSTGGIALVLNAVPYNMLKLDGQNKIATIAYIVSAFVSLTITFVLLIVFKTGVWALAVAICAGGLSSGVIGGIFLLTKSLNFKLAYPHKFLQTTRKMFILGAPGALEFLCFLVRVVVLNNLFAGKFGEHMVAEFKVVDSIGSFALIFVWGLTGSVVSLTSIFSAEHDTKSHLDILKLTLTRGACLMLPIAIGLVIFAEPVASLFGVPSAAWAVRIFAARIPFMFVNQLLTNLYQGLKRIFLANTLMALRVTLLVIVLVFPLSLISEQAVWWSFALAEALALIIVFIMTEFSRRNHKNLLPLLLIDVSAERSGRYKSFSVENGRVSEASAGIYEFCEQNKLSPKLTMHISLAIEEILAVIFEKSMPKSVSVRVLVIEETGVIILRIRAAGRLCNLVDWALKASDQMDMDVIGIKMILKLAVNVDYSNTFGVNNTTITLKERELETVAS